MSLFELRPAHARPASGTIRPAAGPVAALGQERSGDGTTWWTLVAIAALAACGLAVVVGTAVVSGDGVWHLIWGRELAEGTLGSFATGPTPHPSLLVLGAATSVLGDDTSYLVTYLLFGPLAFGVLIAAVFDVARRLSSHWAGATAVLILVTSVGLVSIASAARYDVAFAALVVTAISLEMAGRRPFAPLACLAVAGLVRPEAWFLAGAYWLWVVRPLSWPARAGTAGLVALAPALWMTMDLLVMGDPLYSLHLTDAASEVLYGQYTAVGEPRGGRAQPRLVSGRRPAALHRPGRRAAGARPPAGGAAAAGRAGGHDTGLFLLLLWRGMASSERYLLVPICVLAILAAIAVDGGGRRTPRRVMLGSFLAVILCLQLATRADVYGTVANDSAIAHGHYESARALVGMPGVGKALRSCPQVSLPTGKMRHWFAFYSGRPPVSFVSDGEGITHPDLYIAPGNPAVAKMALTRPRFDDDASFTIPSGLRPGPRNADWVLYVAPASGCTRGLR